MIKPHYHFIWFLFPFSLIFLGILPKLENSGLFLYFSGLCRNANLYPIAYTMKLLNVMVKEKNLCLIVLSLQFWCVQWRCLFERGHFFLISFHCWLPLCFPQHCLEGWPVEHKFHLCVVMVYLMFMFLDLSPMSSVHSVSSQCFCLTDTVVNLTFRFIWSDENL